MASTVRQGDSHCIPSILQHFTGKIVYGTYKGTVLK